VEPAGPSASFLLSPISDTFTLRHARHCFTDSKGTGLVITRKACCSFHFKHQVLGLHKIATLAGIALHVLVCRCQKNISWFDIAVHHCKPQLKPFRIAAELGCCYHSGSSTITTIQDSNRRISNQYMHMKLRVFPSPPSE
jgi:hypothetical protein